MKTSSIESPASNLESDDQADKPIVYATTFGQTVHPDIRSVVRSQWLTLSAQAAKLSGWLSSSLVIPRVQFLCFHHLFADEEAGFRRLLEQLAESTTLVSYSEAVDRINTNRIDRPYLTFSFDDGFRNCFRAAAILNEFGVSGCFFVCPGIMNESDPQKVARLCLHKVCFPKPVEFLSWDQARELIEQGHEIGGHTMTHADLGQISESELDDEISGCYQHLVGKLGRVKHFSWPRGLWHNFTPAARRVVYRAGFQSCASAVRGCHIGPPPKEATSLCIRRDHVIARWPVGHTLYFLARNARKATDLTNHWPDEYGILE